MDYDPTASIDHRTADEKIADAVRNKIYQEMAITKNRGGLPLLADELPESVVKSPRFQEVSRIGWVHESDAPLEPVYDYAPDEFVNQIFSNTALVDSFRGTADADELMEEARRKNLNNFNELLKARPGRIGEDGSVIKADDTDQMDRLYGSVPALIRAYAVAPDLMEGLHQVINTAPNTKDLYINNRDFLAGAYMAYKIMGRLVNPDDGTLQNRIFAEPGAAIPEGETFTSAHRALTR